MYDLPVIYEPVTSKVVDVGGELFRVVEKVDMRLGYEFLPQNKFHHERMDKPVKFVFLKKKRRGKAGDCRGQNVVDEKLRTEGVAMIIMSKRQGGNTHD